MRCGWVNAFQKNNKICTVMPSRGVCGEEWNLAIPLMWCGRKETWSCRWRSEARWQGVWLLHTITSSQSCPVDVLTIHHSLQSPAWYQPRRLHSFSIPGLSCVTAWICQSNGIYTEKTRNIFVHEIFMRNPSHCLRGLQSGKLILFWWWTPLPTISCNGNFKSKIPPPMM